MLPREHVLLRWETLRRHNIPLGEPLYARPLDGSGQPRRVLAWAGRKLQPASQSTTAGVHRSHGESGVELWVGQATTRSEPRAYLHQPRDDAAAAKPRDATSDGLGEGSAVDDELLALAELPLHAPHVFREWGVPAPRGILVHGPAGAGIGARLSRALDAHYVHVSAGDLASRQGAGAEERLAQAFAEARERTPSVLFIEPSRVRCPRSPCIHCTMVASLSRKLTSISANLGQSGAGAPRRDSRNLRNRT
ncbi:hypothetical protein EMIHUDRAFT_469728, partial [Emiliania huxleyi CCMP1516]|uniref:ATPase AAA-type core domain-containing protein n=2 Tax=Emiliania huxleyi TaxID=2903 RepID=A0A0D3JEE5_EMIH1